jgi:hypothetical protein
VVVTIAVAALVEESFRTQGAGTVDAVKAKLQQLCTTGLELLSYVEAEDLVRILVPVIAIMWFAPFLSTKK